MLDLMQRQNVAAEKQERLATLVEEVGGEPNPMNLALAQETVYRAFAEANFQSERRHDGVRVEIEKTIADILKDHAKAPATRSITPRRGSSLRPSPHPRLSSLEKRPRPSKAPETNMRRRLPTPRPAKIPAKAARTKPLTLDEHPFVVLAEGIIQKNADAKAWDTKSQRQVRQISRLFARLLLEQGVVEFEDIHQSTWAISTTSSALSPRATAAARETITGRSTSFARSARPSRHRDAAWSPEPSIGIFHFWAKFSPIFEAAATSSTGTST